MIHRRQLLIKAFKLFDLIVMVYSFALATVIIHYHSGIDFFTHFLSMRIKVGNIALFLGFLLVWHMLFSLFELYHSRRLSNQREEIKDVIKASFLGTVVIFIAASLINIRMITPAFVVVFWVTSAGITIVSRFVLRYVLGRIRTNGRNLRHMLIAGTNPRAIQFAKKIEGKPELGYRIIGFVDDEYSKNGGFQESGYKVVSDFKDFPVFLRDHVVDEVAISLPMKSLYDEACTVVSLCKEQGIMVRFPSDLFNLKVGESKAEQFEDDSMITVSTGAMKGWQLLVKRTLDFLLSSILLVIFSPLFVVIALLIKLASPGSVLFIQDRVGLNKRRFRLYKFRTMIPGAEKKQDELEELNEVSGPVFKIKNDPRVTRIGKLLRKTSVDELPQLINVLKGDMSLVGPRPLPIRDCNGFDKDWQRRRFSIRPGITCLWQINGRSAIAFEKWMKLDMEYIDNWSLWLDLKILAKTVPAVLKESGAS